MSHVIPGLQQFVANVPASVRHRRTGLLTNPSGIDNRLRTNVDQLDAHPDVDLRALYGPEHGVRGDVQAGDHVADAVDARSGLPVYSLYGATRTPSVEMLEPIDVLVIDLQDIGVRYATYLASVANAMEGCRAAGVDVVILDRPNPLGGTLIAGNILDPAFASFVGMPGLTTLHGLTIGEFARFWADAADLPTPEVVPMSGWQRTDWFDNTHLPWVLPSPNLPTLDSVTCYPAVCLIEGTNLSEARGTTRPFELLGAPWVDPEGLAKALNGAGLPGVGFRPTWFSPWISKHKGELCGGVQLYVFDREGWDPIRTGVIILQTLKRMYPDEFGWTGFNEGGTFVDKLAGTNDLRLAIDGDGDIEDLLARWDREATRFAEIRLPFMMPEYA